MARPAESGPARPVLYVDLDGTLCTLENASGNYAAAKPIPGAIEAVNRWYREGAYIIIFTARSMRTAKGDVAKAKDELKQCGKPSGFSTTLTARADRPAEVAAATAIQNSLKAAGIKVDIKQFPSGKYFSNFAGVPSYVHSHKLGTLVGKRTWGGLVHTADTPLFVDGGSMIAPRGGFFAADGHWASFLLGPVD